MASITGIELKPDSCVLAGLRPTRAGVDVSALHVIGASDWPGQDLAVAEALRGARTSKRMPRRARVVVWGIPDHGSADDPATLALLRPLTTAGFKIQAVLTPPQALATLAARRPRQPGSAAVAWLALNMHGAAIAIVHGTEVLYTRTFDWLYTPGAAGSSAQLLQRYTLVAHLSPELRHGIAHVRASHGVPVDTAVTCGDLPDLRSLTMPLIEELDLEFETLDSTEGLRPIGRAQLDRFAELAPAMRLASATAMIARPRSRRESAARKWIPAAAVLALVVGGAAYLRWSVQEPTPPASVPANAPPSSQTRGTTPPGPSSSPVAGRAAPAAESAAAQPPQTQVVQAPSTGSGQVPSTSSARAPSTPTQVVIASPPRTAPNPEQQTRAGADKQVTQGSLAAAQARSNAQPGLTVSTPPAVYAPRSRGPSPRVRPAVAPQPLKEPLPRVDSILIDRDRRLAIIDDAIRGVGDAVGARTVAEIDREAVVLREPSGLEIRIPLRPATPRQDD